MSGRVVHFEIPFDDAERAHAFYREAFGWNLMDVPGMDYTMVTTGPTGDQGASEPGYINGGMLARQSPNTSPLVVVDVEDIDAALATIESLGGQTLSRKQPVGEMGWAAYFQDVEGNTLGLWQSR
ncbi:MAG TPA: VOC family protein [Nocardioides sp.]|nr:VOC family protein [Nocardioides sp.]